MSTTNMFTRNLSLISLLFITLPLSVSAQSGLQLLEAAKNSDIEALGILLNDSGMNINAAKADGTTALHWAVHWNDRDMVNMLLSAGANPDLANDYGVTPVFQACVNSSDHMVIELLKAGANPNSMMITGVSALMKCSQTGATGAVLALIKAGADVNVSETRKGQTALMWAASSAHPAIVGALLEAGANVSSRTHGGFTPLMFAARSGDLETARLLVEAGANPNEASDKEGNTLIIASAGGHEELALYLLSVGADPGQADEYGLTSLHHAVRGGLSQLHGVRYDPIYRVQPDNMHDLARALLDAGSDPNAQIIKARQLGPDGSPFSMVGATPLMLAAVSADIKLMRLMSDYEADPQINSIGGNTPLMAAARAACTGSCAFQGGNVEISEENIQLSLQAVKMAVEMGVDVNAANEIGRTALHMAAFTGADAVVQYLAEHGADVNVSDNNGETPWSMASGISPGLRYRGLYGAHESTAALLIKLGAKVVTLEEMNPKAKHRQ
jgi:ankyrin repeat protein